MGKIVKKLCHDYLGWHIPSDECNFDGCSIASRCVYCGKRVLQDSQGNWFDPDEYIKEVCNG